jgi:hypothetical protein
VAVACTHIAPSWLASQVGWDSTALVYSSGEPVPLSRTWVAQLGVPAPA